MLNVKITLFLSLLQHRQQQQQQVSNVCFVKHLGMFKLSFVQCKNKILLYSLQHREQQQQQQQQVCNVCFDKFIGIFNCFVC